MKVPPATICRNLLDAIDSNVFWWSKDLQILKQFNELVASHSEFKFGVDIHEEFGPDQNSFHFGVTCQDPFFGWSSSVVAIYMRLSDSIPSNFVYTADYLEQGGGEIIFRENIPYGLESYRAKKVNPIVRRTILNWQDAFAADTTPPPAVPTSYALTTDQQKIVAKCDGVVLTQVEIEAATEVSKRTIAKECQALEAMGILHRPYGPRKGYTKKN